MEKNVGDVMQLVWGNARYVKKKGKGIDKYHKVLCRGMPKVFTPVVGVCGEFGGINHKSVAYKSGEN